MDNYTYEGTNQRKIELFLLFVYTFYSNVMLILSVIRKWEIAVGLTFLTCVSISWIVVIGKVKTYRFRAYFTAVMIQIAMTVYAINVEKLSAVIPVFLGFVVFMGLYGIAKIINITAVSATVILIYYLVFLEESAISGYENTFQLIAQIANIYFVEFIIYLWAKNNSEGSRQLLKTIGDLKELESSKDDFLANVSHEIRTPINTICGLSEIILNRDLSDELKEEVMGIQIAGRNLTSAVRDILDFSELQSGKMELEEESYNIASTINDIINMSMARKNEKDIELIVDCDANIPCGLLGDEKKIRRIIMNLVDNAIKFTEQGFVSIEVHFRRESYGINLVVSVKDSGMGMDEKNVDTLFDSFSQADTSRKRHEAGMGLGLAISRALADKMGAAITVKSKIGKGTLVKVVIPQKIVDETPVAALNDRMNISVGTYIDMEQFDIVEIREEYLKNISHMVEQLQGKCHICRNLPELQRRLDRKEFTHVFISDVEYVKDKEFFDKIAKEVKLIVVLDHEDDKKVSNTSVIRVYKPYYIISIVSAINGVSREEKEVKVAFNGKFITKNVHILAVDDNKMNLRVIEGFLKEYQIKVTTALSGAEAMEKIKSKDYDFVFMDHMMPGMDGVETLHNIRKMGDSYYQRVPIIALTANAVAGSRENLMEQGFNDFLEKPVERSVLERVLKRNISENKLIYISDEEFAKNESADAKATDEFSMMKEILEKNELDVDKAIVYCNGKDQYIEILKNYCQENNELQNQIEELFDEQDWKNYTIAIHGMKSSMRSIGASEVSEVAADLEKAGHEGNINYIILNHNTFMEQYRKLFDKLCQYEWLCPKNNEESLTECQELKEIEDNLFEEYIDKMEEAMYSFDKDEMMNILLELNGYMYNGKLLKKELAPVVRKVEQSDYMSAVEMIIKLKKKLSRREE